MKLAIVLSIVRVVRMKLGNLRTGMNEKEIVLLLRIEQTKVGVLAFRN
jgi:hypothetical protein